MRGEPVNFERPLVAGLFYHEPDHAGLRRQLHHLDLLGYLMIRYKIYHMQTIQFLVVI